jgi:hypothetical protein
VFDDAKLETAFTGEFKHLAKGAVVEVDVEIDVVILGLAGAAGRRGWRSEA